MVPLRRPNGVCRALPGLPAGSWSQDGRIVSWDPAHYPTEGAHEFDRMLDEQEERLERADRYAEKGRLPLPDRSERVASQRTEE